MSSASASKPQPLPDVPVQFTHQQILRVVIGIMLCILLAALDQTVVVPAVPAIASDLNGFGHLSWIVSAYLLTATVATPIYGKLSDIYGRRALLLPALAIFITASMLCGVAQTLLQLIIARAIQGLGGAGLMAMAQAAIADVVSPRERGRYQGYMVSMWGVASIAGPVVGGYVVDYLSWRWIFWANLPLGLVAMFLSNRALKMLRVRRVEAKIDYLGAALMTAGVTSLLLVLSWGGIEYAWTSPVVIGTFVVGVAFIAALVVQERRVADPLLPPRVFVSSVFRRGVAVAVSAAIALFGGTFLLPLNFQLTHGVDAATSGLLVLPFLGANVLGAYIGGNLSRRLGRTKRIIVCGSIGCLLGFAALALVGRHTPMVLILLATALLGLGIGSVMPTSMVTVQNAAERRDVGVATGSLLFLRSMGGAFGSTLVGALLTVRFAGVMAQRGITTPLDMGSLRGGSAALTGLDPHTFDVAQDALASAFRLDYAVCAVLMLVAVVASLGLRDLPLRTVSASSNEGAIGH